MAGLKAARARGKNGGRKNTLNCDEVSSMLTLYESKRHSVVDIYKQMKIYRKSFYNYFKRNQKVPHDINKTIFLRLEIKTRSGRKSLLRFHHNVCLALTGKSSQNFRILIGIGQGIRSDAKLSLLDLKASLKGIINYHSHFDRKRIRITAES